MPSRVVSGKRAGSAMKGGPGCKGSAVCSGDVPAAARPGPVPRPARPKSKVEPAMHRHVARPTHAPHIYSIVDCLDGRVSVLGLRRGASRLSSTRRRDVAMAGPGRAGPAAPQAGLRVGRDWGIAVSGSMPCTASLPGLPWGVVRCQSCGPPPFPCPTTQTHTHPARTPFPASPTG